MRKTAIAVLVLAATCALSVAAIADTSYQSLPFSQNWTNTGLIAANDDWSGVPGIVGYFGDDGSTTACCADLTTLLSDIGSGLPKVFANQSNPTTFTSGGPAEFQIADPVVALQGSGTADAPHLILYLNTTGLGNIQLAYNLRDIDAGTTPATQPVAAYYRVGTSGSWTHIAAAYVANAAGGASDATKVTPVSVTLPAVCNNVPQLQIRIMTYNAAGSDEEIGVDDISVTGQPIGPPTGACCLKNTTLGACVVTTAADCSVQNGVYLGDGALCDPGTCATPTSKSSWGAVKSIYR